jgi:hypothetical protein
MKEAGTSGQGAEVKKKKRVYPAASQRLRPGLALLSVPFDSQIRLRFVPREILYLAKS